MNFGILLFLFFVILILLEDNLLHLLNFMNYSRSINKTFGHYYYMISNNLNMT